MSFNNYNNFPAPGGFANAYQGTQDDSADLDFDLASVNPNAEPWEIAQQLSGSGERDIGSNQFMQRAFNQAQGMKVDIDQATSRSMFEQTNVSSRGGGGTSFSTKLIAGAAGWAAMSYYQNQQRKQGHKVNHAFLKKMVAGIAMAQAIKMFNKQNSGGSFMGFGKKRDIEASREAVAAEAAATAMKLVDESVPQETQFGNQYNSPANFQAGYDAPPQQGYNQPKYGAPSFPQGNYGAPAPPAGGAYGMPQGNFSVPPQGPMGGFPGGPQPNYGAPHRMEVTPAQGGS
ncbi:hypothetical protein L0F63_000270 [Massospora cicadina]|nr:hypothetical protein L0F63_000270 [Massospora cicadina]